MINSWSLPSGFPRPSSVRITSSSGRPNASRVFPLRQGTAARCAEDLVDLPVGVPDVDLGAAPVTVALHIEIETSGGVVERVAAVEPDLRQLPGLTAIGRIAGLLIDPMTGYSV